MFVDSTGKRISIDAQITIEGVTYANLRDPAIREIAQVTEIADPVRENEQYYFVNEIDVEPYVINTPKSVEQVKQLKMAEISAARYAKETSGVALPDGSIVATDRQTQATITSALVRLQRKPTELIDWKGEAGWVKLDKATVELIADAIGDHVQACFTAEKAKLDALELLTEFSDIIAFDTKFA